MAKTEIAVVDSDVIDAEVTETALVPIEGVVESSGDRAVAESPVLPWDNWPDPEFLTSRTNYLGCSLADDGEMNFTHTTGEGTVPLGKATRRSLLNLSKHVVYPTEFVEKLSPPTATAVINERIQACRDREVILSREGDTIVDVAWKEHSMLPMREVAQAAYDAVDGLFPFPLILHEEQRLGGMVVRFGSERLQKAVTTRKGDILQFGVEVRYGYGDPMKVSLYTTRLVCLNGMVADQSEWTWTKKSEGSHDEQKAWLKARVEEMIPRFDETVQRAQMMSETILPHGMTVKELAEQFARQHGIQIRSIPMVVDAFNQMRAEEEGVQFTEWDLLNAFTRAGTHDARFTDDQRENLLVRSGAWLDGNEIVTARLRRSTAERLRAEILPE